MRMGSTFFRRPCRTTPERRISDGDGPMLRVKAAHVGASRRTSSARNMLVFRRTLCPELSIAVVKHFYPRIKDVSGIYVRIDMSYHIPTVRPLPACLRRVVQAPHAAQSELKT